MTTEFVANETTPDKLTEQNETTMSAPLAPVAEVPSYPYIPTRPAKRRLICAREQAARMYDAHP